MAGSTYRAVREGDLAGFSEVLAWSFNMPVDDVEPWLRRAGMENARVLLKDGRTVACLLAIPMGQFFGGTSVPMMGVAGVGTAAEARGTGAALGIMRALLEELAEKGVALSALYPATRSLYRRVGYEPAGCRLELTTPARTLRATNRSLALRAVKPEDESAIGVIYGSYAEGRPGHLDRGPYVWNRVRSPRGEVARGFVVLENDRPEGYIYVFERRLPSLHYDLVVTDVAARTAAAYARLITFLADHATLGDAVVWHGGADHPLLQLLGDRHYDARALQHWMLRIVDLGRALEARGYPPLVATELELEVRDEILPRNAGRFVLSVEAGRARVRPGGRGSLRADVRALASIYSGYARASTLAAMGLVEGDREALGKADAIFASATPSMPDFF
jgi:predicted acetyltransferase